MKLRRIPMPVVLLVILTVIGCHSITSDTLIRVPSFREYYQVFLQEAQKWKRDAYLADARIFLFPPSSNSDLISTVFYSPSDNFESLSIDLQKNGTMNTEIFVHEFPIYHRAPIMEDDWKTDSQEAIDHMLNEAGQRYTNPDKNACSFLLLERVLSTQDQPVVWSLSLWDCSGTVQHFYMDARSGEILDASAVNIKPTRFPTSMPSSP